MTSKWTPGPWTVKESGPAIRYTVMTDEEAIAMTYGQSRQRYDAALMAEAPAMVEALLGLMDIAEMAMPDTYFATDSRVCAARDILARIDGSAK